MSVLLYYSRHFWWEWWEQVEEIDGNSMMVDDNDNQWSLMKKSMSGYSWHNSWVDIEIDDSWHDWWTW